MSKLLKDRYPDVFRALHPLLNKGVDVEKLTHGCLKRVWWSCTECTEGYESKVCDRTRKKGYCPACRFHSSRKTIRFTAAEFIKRAQIVHGSDRYDYSRVIYKASYIKIIIGCIAHQSWFEQQPSAHLNGQGCRQCNLFRSKGCRIMDRVLAELQISYTTEWKTDWLVARDDIKTIKRYDYHWVLGNGREFLLEVDGCQHFGESWLQGEALVERQSVDRLKNTVGQLLGKVMLRACVFKYKSMKDFIQRAIEHGKPGCIYVDKPEAYGYLISVEIDNIIWPQHCPRLAELIASTKEPKPLPTTA